MTFAVDAGIVDAAQSFQPTISHGVKSSASIPWHLLSDMDSHEDRLLRELAQGRALRADELARRLDARNWVDLCTPLPSSCRGATLRLLAHSGGLKPVPDPFARPRGTHQPFVNRRNAGERLGPWG
jgi:hypothetical protein